ncbi:DUF2332 domain-containing protein [Pseudalkalibacillus sp. SCS-8]|uniref:DUF2332 domain-containing protein n=1 Tax=Pseudalkalibacillus nanhaiensis TaxID=3115291 RepID=UPI0032D9CF96
MTIEQLSNRFVTFSKKECAGSSDLYEYLAMNISEDDELLRLCTYAREGQPVPNLLFSAVHYLLLKGTEHPLRDYYPSIVAEPKPVEFSYPAFKDFCKIHRDAITHLLQNKLVQTNEVRRCAYLFPLFSHIYDRVNKPLSLIEIGTSAGLQLLWDKYRYSYGTGEGFGNEKSNVHIHSEIKGDVQLQSMNIPPVATRVGLDLHVSDLRDPEDHLWLKALIWPEHDERIELFEQASQCIQENQVDLMEGDGVALLNEVVEELPKDTAICIFHTHVANQIPEEMKRTLLEKIRKIGEKRDVFHIYNNMWDRKLHLDSFINGTEYNEIIGDTDGHGRWFEWNLNTAYVGTSR